MSPVTITIFSDVRKVSVGLASGFGCTASRANVREHPAASKAIARSLAACMPLAWRVAPTASTTSRASAIWYVRYGSASKERAGVRRAASIGCDFACESSERVGHVRAVDHTKPPRQVDRTQQVVRAIDVVVDDQVPVLVEVFELGLRFADAALDHVRSIGRARAQA